VDAKDLAIEFLLALLLYELAKREQRRELARELERLRTFMAERLPLPEPVRVRLAAPLRLEAHLGKTVIRRDSQGNVISEERR
jgi:hypothetical protein